VKRHSATYKSHFVVKASVYLEGLPHPVYIEAWGALSGLGTITTAIQ